MFGKYLINNSLLSVQIGCHWFNEIKKKIVAQTEFRVYIGKKEQKGLGLNF